MDNHSDVNKISLNSYNYNYNYKDEASSAEETSQCFNRKVTHKNSKDNKTESPEQKKFQMMHWIKDPPLLWKLRLTME